MIQPETLDEWQALFASHFESGVLLTVLSGGIRSPEQTQMLGHTVFVKEYDEDDNAPMIVVQDVYDDYPFHFVIEEVAVKVEGHVLAVSGNRPGLPAPMTVELSNRLMNDQRTHIEATQ